MAPDKPAAKDVPIPNVPPSRRNPGRAATKRAEDMRGKWVCHHDSIGRDLLRTALRNLPDDAPEERRAALSKALRAVGEFKPYKRTEPKIKHRRGAVRRLAAKIAKAMAEPPA